MGGMMVCLVLDVKLDDVGADVGGSGVVCGFLLWNFCGNSGDVVQRPQAGQGEGPRGGYYDTAILFHVKHAIDH